MFLMGCLGCGLRTPHVRSSILESQVVYAAQTGTTYVLNVRKHTPMPKSELADPEFAMDLKALTQTSYEIAKSKGWWENPRGFAALTLLMQSEISEALEDYRNGKRPNQVWYEYPPDIIDSVPVLSSGERGKPCGIPSEIADVIIRICDFAGHYDLKLEHMYYLGDHNEFTVLLARANWFISKAWDVLDYHGLDHHDHRVQVGELLSEAIAFLLALCSRYEIDIEAAIKTKTEFNRTRPMRHGGKEF